MYGSSGKYGRGGATGGRGGATKRHNPLNSSFHSTPPTHRSSSATPGSRYSSGHRSRSATPASAAPPAAPPTEETFSVVTRNPLDFGMIIRLVPDLVEEIKRVEADGGTARIKFDPNDLNCSGVIQVGNKNFRFTWSREVGDLCDIYEERQSGEDGNGLLVESGCAWRKLSVQRVLDESTKNHVKMRSVEAEKNRYLRKTIPLEPGNPSTKKVLAAAEANPGKRHVKQTEPEFKKRKIGGHSANHPKSVQKSGLPSSTPSKGMQSVSPLLSTPENHGASISPLGTRTPAKGLPSVEEVMNQGASQKSVASSVKDMFNKAGSVREKQVRKGHTGAKSMDLHSMLISVLKENPKGMNMKQLEKAIGDTVPNSVGKIEPVVKKIATYQAPGRYVLKPGIELEDSKKPLSESGSSPQDNRHQTPAPAYKDHDTLSPSVSLVQTVATEEVEKQAQLNSNVGEDLGSLEKVDILLNSPPRVDDKKNSERSEGHTDSSSSSESGSDSESDSESSDSGSDSGSRSRSKSRSASSSDSDASNSQQGPDEDVDIISDDEKQLNPQFQAPALGVPISPVPWIPEDGPSQNGNEKQDDNDSDIVEIEKDSSDEDQGIEMSASNLSSMKEIEKTTQDVKISSPDLQQLPTSQLCTGNLLGERDSDAFKLEQANNSERTGKGKSKRSAESKSLYEKSEHTKRLKSGSFPQPQSSQSRDLLLSESPHNLSPCRVIEEPSKVHTNRGTNNTLKDAGDFPGLQKGLNQGLPGKSVLEENSGRKHVETSLSTKAPDIAEKLGTTAESLVHGIKYPERNHHLNEGHNDKVLKGVHGEGYTKDKKMPRNSKDSSFGDKHSIPRDSCNGTYGEGGGKIKEAGGLSQMQTANPPKNDYRTDTERPPSLNGRGKMLHRELSDLELGELREPLPEEIPGSRKDFGRKGSFKQSDNIPNTSGLPNSDLNKGRSTAMMGSGKPSSPRLRAGVSPNPDSSSKRRSPVHHAEDLTRPFSRAVQYQPPGSQHMSRIDHNEHGMQKLAEGNGKKASAVAQQQAVNGRGPLIHPTKETKTHKSSILSDLSDTQKDNSFTGSDELGGLKRRESSSDENSCSYSKYEKEDPEFRGPIRDFTEYKECVQEYREKYDSYCSLNKTLESYRNDFQKLGRDLETAKARDKQKYFHLLGQLKDSYRQCGTRHKRLKKIFIVLHEELKHLKQTIKDYAVSHSKD